MAGRERKKESGPDSEVDPSVLSVGEKIKMMNSHAKTNSPQIDPSVLSVGEKIKMMNSHAKTNSPQNSSRAPRLLGRTFERAHNHSSLLIPDLSRDPYCSPVTVDRASEDADLRRAIEMSLEHLESSDRQFPVLSADSCRATHMSTTTTERANSGLPKQMSGSRLPTAVPIVTFGKNSMLEEPPVFLSYELESILKKGNAMNKKVFVISITGVYRSGKSFLLNLLQSYLDYCATNGDSDRGWVKSNLRIEGGAWARSENAVTHGIWMWNRPFIYNNVAVLLMDCQGTGDSQNSDPTLDNMIMYIGLEASNVQMMNLSAVLQSTDIEKLELCADYADEPSAEAIFDSLIFLIRDWKHDKQFGHKPDKFQQILTSSRVMNSARGVNKAFKYITTYVLPHPGETVEFASHTLTMNETKDSFMQAVEELFKGLFQNILPRTSLITGSEFLRKFKALERRAVDDLGKVQILTSAQALEESRVNKAFIAAQQYFDTEIQRLSNKDHKSEAELKRAMGDVMTSALEMFRIEVSSRYKCHEQSAIYRRYRNLLNEKRGTLDAKRKVIMEKVNLLAQVREIERVACEYEASKRKLEIERKTLQDKEAEIIRKQKEDKKARKALERERDSVKRQAIAEAREAQRLIQEKENQEEKERLAREDAKREEQKLELERKIKEAEELHNRLVKESEKIKAQNDLNVIKAAEPLIVEEKPGFFARIWSGFKSLLKKFGNALGFGN